MRIDEESLGSIRIGAVIGSNTHDSGERILLGVYGVSASKRGELAESIKYDSGLTNSYVANKEREDNSKCYATLTIYKRDQYMLCVPFTFILTLGNDGKVVYSDLEIFGGHVMYLESNKELESK